MGNEGLSPEELLFAYGFIKSSEAREKYGHLSPEDRIKLLKKKQITRKDCMGWVDNHEIEIAKWQRQKTGFPEPIWFHYIIYESFQASLEESYYWLLNYLRYDLGFAQVYKVTDVFAASEHSSYFGTTEQRLGIQQDRISSFLATIGKMTKDVFQLVRELRILDERIEMYENTKKTGKGRESAEISLKGIWIDLVEGGSKNPGSVFGLARELQFTTLPDLFFAVHPPTSQDVDDYVNKLQFNAKVKEVLKRKLRQYLQWKESTYKEIKWRRTFTLKYLRQHYLVIRMYMQWVRPYMKHLKRLSSDTNRMDRPDIVSAFESSTIEVELLGRQIFEGNSRIWSCALISMHFRTTPQMSFVDQGSYQRGPIHVGEVRIQYRAYLWDENQIKNYLAMREREDWELMLGIDEALRGAMEDLDSDLRKYLEESGEVFETPEKEKPAYKPQGLMSPFKDLLGSFTDIFTAFKTQGGKQHEGSGSFFKSGKSRKEQYDIEQERKRAMPGTRFLVWLSYKNYKAAHRMLTW